MNYAITKRWFLPIAGGYSINHFSQVKHSPTWKGKAFHILTGLVEAIPILGHVASIVEKCFACPESVFSIKRSPNRTVVSILGRTVYESWGRPNPVHYTKKLTSIVSHQPDKPLLVRANNGSITVIQSDRDDVRITAKFKAHSKELVEKAEIVKERQSDGTLDIKPNWPSDEGLVSDESHVVSKGCDFEIEIPSAQSIHLETGNGNVTTRGLAGGALLRTWNGNITVENHQGMIFARSPNGNITVIRMKHSVNLETSNGDILLSKDEHYSGKLNLQTESGTITDRNRILTESGTITHRDRILKDKDVIVSIGQGNTISTVKTKNGNIVLR